MTIKKLLLRSEDLVSTLVEEINFSNMSLKEAEKKIVQFIKRIDQIMTDEVVEKVEEPTVENTLILNGKVATYHEMRALRFINRFGGQRGKYVIVRRFKSSGMLWKKQT